MIDTGVHQSHCCAVHGCKYGDPLCPVDRLMVVQEYSCEQCSPYCGEYLEFRVVRANREEADEWFATARECVAEFLHGLDPLERSNARMEYRTVTHWYAFGVAR